jgi:hypothetical protein
MRYNRATLGTEDTKIALANISIDASSILPRSHNPDDSLPKFTMVFILQREILNGQGRKIKTEIDPKTGEPKIAMARDS